MSFKANLAIILHLQEFRNLGLPHKARFALRAEIYQGKDMQVDMEISRMWQCLSTLSKPSANRGRTSAGTAKSRMEPLDRSGSTSSTRVVGNGYR
jgi:hypothetical protein